MHERVKLLSHYNLIKQNEKINLLLIKFIYLKGNNVLREATFKCIKIIFINFNPFNFFMTEAVII